MHTCPVCGCECDCQGDIEDHHNESLSATCECYCVEFAEDVDTLRHTLDDDDRGGLHRERPLEEFDEDNNNSGDAARKE